MKKKCPNCKLVNFAHSDECGRCKFDLIEVVSVSNAQEASLVSTILRRALVCGAVCLISILGFYFSLMFSADPLSAKDKESVAKAIAFLEQKGFSGEVFLLNYVASFRSNDNWLNASVVKENAYAATNYPFGILTIYPDFFEKTADDTERAAILLHEAKHLSGQDEKTAYEFVWKNRKKLGWTKDQYNASLIWQNIRNQTREYAPNLFICELNDYGDCSL